MYTAPRDNDSPPPVGNADDERGKVVVSIDVVVGGTSVARRRGAEASNAPRSVGGGSGGGVWQRFYECLSGPRARPPTRHETHTHGSVVVRYHARLFYLQTVIRNYCAAAINLAAMMIYDTPHGALSSTRPM